MTPRISFVEGAEWLCKQLKFDNETGELLQTDRLRHQLAEAKQLCHNKRPGNCDLD
jgi:hypothetical protein